MDIRNLALILTVTLLAVVARADLVCQSLFDAGKRPIAQQAQQDLYPVLSNRIHQLISATFTNVRGEYATVDMTHFNNMIHKISNALEYITNEQLVTLIDSTLQEDHQRKGYIAGLSPSEAKIKTLAQLVKDLDFSLSGEQYMQKNPSVSAHSAIKGRTHQNRYWKNFLGNILSQHIFMLLNEQGQQEVAFDPAEIENHILIYIAHKEAIRRLKDPHGPLLRALRVEVTDPNLFAKELSLLAAIMP